MTADHASVSSLENEQNQPTVLVPVGRGGPQEIPRPEGARIGGPAPWAHIPVEDRRVTLAGIVEAFSRHRDPRLVGTAGEGIGRSAVLVLLYERSDDVYMVLTRRSPRLRHHAHEVAFPGGRHEADDGDLWTTAVREAQEEVGIDPSTIRRIGELDSFVTVESRTMVTPFVAATDRQPRLERDPIEVELIRHVSFSELLLDEVWREEFWPLPPRPSGPFDDFRSPILAGSEAVARAARPRAERPGERAERPGERPERPGPRPERPGERSEQERETQRSEQERETQRSEQEREAPRDEPRAITFFELVGDTVWGATGAMLRQLLTIATGVEDAANTDGTANARVVVG